jgi:hypothetical protein
VCTGFVSLEVFPSPKFHFQEFDPVLWSVKPIVRGALPEIGEAEKLVTGVFGEPVTVIKPDFVNSLLPFALLDFNVTGNIPVLLYVCTGFFSIEELPSPKLHFHEFGDPVLWSVKLTVKGTLPDV